VPETASDILAFLTVPICWCDDILNLLFASDRNHGIGLMSCVFYFFTAGTIVDFWADSPSFRFLIYKWVLLLFSPHGPFCKQGFALIMSSM